MKQHAFIFQVHKQPELFGRIIKILAKENHHFFINVDSKVRDFKKFADVVNGVKNVHFLPQRWNVHHGGRSQYLCTLALLRLVREKLPHFDFVHSLSGQDYPLRTNEQFDDFFENTDNGFMAIESDEYNRQCMESKYPSRVNLWHFNNPHTLIARIYNHCGLMDLLSMILKRVDIHGLRGGGGAGLLGLLQLLIMC